MDRRKLMGRFNKKTIPGLQILLSLLLPAFGSEWEDEPSSNRATMESTSVQKRPTRNQREGSNAVPPLQGSIQLSEQLPPLAPGLRAGAQFDARYLEPRRVEETWHWKPRWAAGIHKRDVTSRVRHIFGMRLDSTIKAESIDGTEVEQMDKLGGIWFYQTPPGIERIVGESWIEYKKIVDWSEIKTTNDEWITRNRSTTLRVNKFTGVIERVYQQEQLSFMLPLPMNSTSYRLNSYCKFYDENGRPHHSKIDKFYCNYHLIQPFTPTDVYQGKDMRQSFKRFLLSNGMADRVPDHLRD